MFILIVSVLLWSESSFAILDYLTEKGDEIAKTVAYTDAVSDLLEEISPDSSLSQSASQLDKNMKILRRETRDITYLGREIEYILNGPNWNSKYLVQNIRRTTSFVRRLKRMIIRLGALGVDGATALNTFETNVSLNDIMKNQQSMILLEREKQFLELQRRQQERRSWHNFISSERLIRGKE